jgi:hypothetical protein
VAKGSRTKNDHGHEATRTIAGGSSYLTFPHLCDLCAMLAKITEGKDEHDHDYRRKRLTPRTQLDIADLKTVQFRYDRKGRHAVGIDLLRFD